MQEQVERESIAIVLKATKLTENTLAKALKSVGRKIVEVHKKGRTPHGCQSVKKLMNHNCSTNTIPIEGDKGLFEKIAKKWNVDYAFHKTGKNKYLLLFKTGQADAITAAFSEYSKKIIKRSKDKQKPIKEQFKEATKQAEGQEKQHKEKARDREVTRD